MQGCTGGAGVKRVGIARSTKPISAVSKRRQRVLPAWAVLRSAKLVAEPSCARCGEAARDVHHRWSLGRGGPLLAPLSMLLSLCRLCHDHLHHSGDGQVEGRERGWLLSAGDGARELERLGG